ncbi:hydrogen peroxide-inducible genes activator [Reinekea marina]|uniref:Hydrogen peroxide-inducible genes activator n=1 Tax=Reinekea marina TaxID=1310421 RepID=A0ABV7WQM0_9GAMM|nr:hydrogen peroxide-inducible genes activator [Reinekea marina]MDN3650674.1 hydrogen peroxide-inducible genes activator [Reinekea marina]
MTLTELKYIIALAQEKHFGRAAQRCSVAQPTLSVAIRKMEDKLKVAIFERNKNGVTVTPIGEKIVAQANRVLEETVKIDDIANAGKDQLLAPIRLGVIFTIGPYLLPHIIPQLRTTTPNMPLSIEENFTANLRLRLREGHLDALIIALPFNETDVLTKPLYDEPFDILLPAQHPLAAQKDISEQELSAENLLLLGQGHCFRDQILDDCPLIAAATRNPEGKTQTMADGTSLETLRHMVASNLGITILPRSATGSHLYKEDLVVVRPFRGQAPTRTVALAWRTSFPRPSAIDAIEGAIRLCKTH